MKTGSFLAKIIKKENKIKINAYTISAILKKFH